MGKRQTRYFKDEIFNNSQNFFNKELNMVLSNGKTICGIIRSLIENKYTILDMFGTQHIVIVDDIEEIIIDHVAPY